MRPEVFDELDPVFLLLPELEVAVAARRDDEVSLRGDTVSDDVTVP